MEVSCFLKKCFYGFLMLALFLLYVPGIPPHVQYEKFELDMAVPREGPLAENFILDDAERLYEGLINAPESLASRAHNEVFVSLHNGSIARIWGEDFNQIKIVTNIGPGCAGPWEESICGRPLGLRFSKDRKLLVADSYLGIFSVDVGSGKKTLIVNPETPIEGFRPRIIDDLDMDDEGNIYWSDASTSVDLSDGLVELVSEPSGRLIKYNSKTKENEVLLRKIHFANGVQLLPDQKSVLVSETFRHRILRYWLVGPKAGQSEVFVSGLPGMPDNIRPRKKGGFYLSLVTTRHPDFVDLFEMTSKMPKLRKALTRATALVQKGLNFIHSVFPNRFCATLSYKIFNLGVISQWTTSNEAFVVEVDNDGKVIGSLQGSSGILRMISETQQVGNNLFFGSPYVNYLGRLRLSAHPSDPNKAKSKPSKPSTSKDEL